MYVLFKAVISFIHPSSAVLHKTPLDISYIMSRIIGTCTLHVKKLWTSMYNSACNCDFKNLIAPLNSLGTLEIYQVIKTAN